MSEELMVRLVEELWASFGYDTPEDHAKVIYNLIAKELIEKFIGRLQNLLERKESYGGELESFIIEEIEEYKKSLQKNEKKNETRTYTRR